MRRKIKWIRYIASVLCLCLLSLVLFAAFNRVYVNGAFAEYADLKEVQPNIFVAPDLDQKTTDSLLLVVQQAKERNESFWNEPIELPRIIFCSTPQMSDKYVMVSGTHAESIFTIFSRHIVINQTGLNVDIVSHELAHVAVYDRIKHFKWLTVTYKLPVWFDEGVAMQLDYREGYSTADYLKHTKQGTKAPALSSMVSLSDFYKQDTLGWYKYATSRYEVNRWLKKVGKAELKKLIYSTTIFSDFNDAYMLAEEQYQ